MTELEMLVDFHLDSERQGPGSPEETLLALNLAGMAGKAGIKIADIGCGSGGQTLTLARNTKGKITAVDLFPEFLEKLKHGAEKNGVGDRIQTVECSMDNLPFKDEEFDLIWSEGAVYNIGFKKGVKSWRRYLKPGGLIAVSEVTWLTDSRPEEIEDFWNMQYPEIDTASAKIRILEENGYSPAGYFTLSPESWLKNYYRPMEERFTPFLEKYDYSDLAEKVIEEHRDEIRMFEKYKEYYSYGFYIARKI